MSLAVSLAFTLFASLAAHAADSAPADAEGRRVLRVAVYGFDAAGADDRLVRIVASAVVAEVRKLQRVSVVTLEEVKVLLDFEAQKQLAGCSQESCLAEIAEALGVDVIVTGQMAQVGPQTVFGLKRLDQHSAKVVGAVTKTIEAEDKGAAAEGVLALVGPAVEELFPDHPLRPGQTRGVEPELARRINPPPLQPWIFWTGAATTGAAMLGALAAGVVNAAAWADAQGFVDEKIAAGAPVEGSDLNTRVGTMRAAFWTGVGAASVAAVAGAATGVVALFTDWDGDAVE